MVVAATNVALQTMEIISSIPHERRILKSQRPKPLTNSERQARWRSKLRAAAAEGLRLRDENRTLRQTLKVLLDQPSDVQRVPQHGDNNGQV